MAELTTSIDTADVLAIDSAVMQSSGSSNYGVTEVGFVPKPFARLLAEKLSIAQRLFGDDIDLSSGSTIRKLMEITALEEARTWSSLATAYDNNYVVSATGQALSYLGAELGYPRPSMRASGSITLKLVGDLPLGSTEIEIPRGARLLTEGGHHIALRERVSLDAKSKEKETAVVAFYPGPEHNLDPNFSDATGANTQRIDRWHPLDPSLRDLLLAEQTAGAPIVEISHTSSLSGGSEFWSDERYRALLLAAPRSLWSVEAIEIAASLIPGVRAVQVTDGWGGLDINQSVFGNFNFIERVFSGERDLGSPYYFTVLVAPTADAIWEGQDGLSASVASAIEDLRPISIFPRIEQAVQIGVGIECKLVVKGIPLPTGSKSTVNSSLAARELKSRLLLRAQRYVDGLKFGEPVRASEMMWALMNEPGVTDIQDLQLVSYPPGFDTVDFTNLGDLPDRETYACGENVTLSVNQIPEFVQIDDGIEII